MTQIKAASEPAKDAKAVKPPRKISGVAFPYYNLAQSVEVAKVIYEKAGGSCDRVQLAALLGYNGVNNGSFLTRVTAAKMFGFIEQEGNQLRVTPRGRKVVAPVDPTDKDQAKIEAFLGVELFKKVFDEYNGRPLPPEVGLKNLLEQTHAVIPDRVGPTVRIMLDSAEEAGLFKTAGNRSKMVMPLSSPGAAVAKQPPAAADPPPMRDAVRHGGNGSGGGGGGGGAGIHPAILGLLNDLPVAGTKMSPVKRTSLIAAFTAMVNWLYPDREADTTG